MTFSYFYNKFLVKRIWEQYASIKVRWDDAVVEAKRLGIQCSRLDEFIMGGNVAGGDESRNQMMNQPGQVEQLDSSHSQKSLDNSTGVVRPHIQTFLLDSQYSGHTSQNDNSTSISTKVIGRNIANDTADKSIKESPVDE